MQQVCLQGLKKMSNIDSTQLELAEATLAHLDQQARVFDPQKAKLAAALLRDLSEQVDAKEKELVELKEKVAAYSKQDSCLDLANEMAELGHIGKDFEFIKKKAASLRNQDLEVVREAIKLAQDKFSSVGDELSDGVRSTGVDAITAAIFGDLG